MGDLVRYIVRCSGGNDSIACIQLVHEHRLEGVVVSYSNTGWASPEWCERMAAVKAWAESLGHTFAEIQSVGFERNVIEQTEAGMFPTRLRKHCTKYLKILPALRWMADVDPDRRAVVCVGVRRAESAARAKVPVFLPEKDDGRHVWHPLAEFSDEDRDALIARTPIPLLDHRSDECAICINATRPDLLRASEDHLARVEALETRVGRPMFNPEKYMGATGIREVRRWAESARGKYQAPPADDLGADCEDGWCGI
jgi:3'-phosphoadenosine 5'-phosphosulfate sulfotransferase (PAPS reductase)/FAD synthetase